MTVNLLLWKPTATTYCFPVVKRKQRTFLMFEYLKMYIIGMVTNKNEKTKHSHHIGSSFILDKIYTSYSEAKFLFLKTLICLLY